MPSYPDKVRSMIPGLGLVRMRLFGYPDPSASSLSVSSYSSRLTDHRLSHPLLLVSTSAGHLDRVQISYTSRKKKRRRRVQAAFLVHVLHVLFYSSDRVSCCSSPSFDPRFPDSSLLREFPFPCGQRRPYRVPPAHPRVAAYETGSTTGEKSARGRRTSMVRCMSP